jgi:hypothetical protein
LLNRRLTLQQIDTAKLRFNTIFFGNMFGVWLIAVWIY